MIKVAIVGASDLGQQIAHFIRVDSKDEVTCFFDDYKLKGSFIEGIEVIGGISDINKSYIHGKFNKIICAIGYNHLKKKREICEEISKEQIPFYTFIHSSSLIDISSIIEDGCIIFPGCIIDQRVVILKHSILNLGVIISHDSKVGECCFFAPNVTIAGFCEVGDFCNIGMSSTIIDNLKISENVRLGAASLVLKSIEKEGTYVGSPCYQLKNKM